MLLLSAAPAPEWMTLQSAISILALIVSVLSLCVNQYFNRIAETRAALRRMLEPDARELGAAMYAVLATGTVYLKKASEEGRANWRTKVAKAKESLESIRPRIRYSLYGADDAVRALIRYADWVQHVNCHDPARADRLTEIANEIRAALDRVVLRCLECGDKPNMEECNHLNKLASNLFFFFNQSGELLLDELGGETPGEMLTATQCGQPAQ